MIAPYPPGIPILMPGERMSEKIAKYLLSLEGFDNAYPGFETETHGVHIRKCPNTGRAEYRIPVLKEKEK